MSVEAVSLVLACFPHGGGMKLLAIALADAATQEGANIFKSIATLATHSGQSERTVQRMLPRLVADGWLIVDGDAYGGRGRTNVYRISQDWMSCAHYECGHAKAERRQPNPVPFRAGELELSTKGDKLAPFTDDKRVTNQTQKGDKNELKGDKSALKGDIHVSPEHRTLNVLTNNPLPPKGGEPEFERLKAAFPRKSVEGMVAANRAWAALLRDGLEPAKEIGHMLRAIHAARQSGAWRGELGEFQHCPALGKWLRGWGAGGAQMAAQMIDDGDESEPDWTQSRASVEREAKACGMGSFEEEAIRHSIKAGVGMQWPQYLALVRERKEAVAA